MELPKLKPNGEVDGTEIDIEAYNVPEEWEPSEDVVIKSRRVILPVRQRDKKIYSTSTKAYLPIVPKGFQQGAPRQVSTASNGFRREGGWGSLPFLSASPRCYTTVWL